MGWRLQWKQRNAPPPGWIDGSVFRPEMHELPRDRLALLELRIGARSYSVRDLFEIDAWDGGMLSLPGSDRWIGIGAGMTEGSLQVDGDAGALAGVGLSGGRLSVNGSTGDYTGAAMTAGRIEVQGNAGSHLGAALPGQSLGVRGGSILVDGDAGPYAGMGQRGGVIGIGGNAEAWAGYQMRAGTLIVGSGELIHVGIEMRRGTIIGLGAKPPESPGFVRDGPFDSTWLTMLVKTLASAGVGNSLKTCLSGANGERSAFEAWRGDLLSLGKGEVLVPLQR